MTDSNWTGRTPRTLGEAFGPYARLTTERDRLYSKTTIDAAIGWLCATGVVVLITLLALGWLG